MCVLSSDLSSPILLALLLLLLDSPPMPLSVVDAVLPVHDGAGNVLIANDRLGGLHPSEMGTIIYYSIAQLINKCTSCI